LIGNCNASRAVGNALNKNFSEKIPCHRIIKSDGSIGGYRGNVPEKIKKLGSEGIKIINGKINLKKFLWNGICK
jgi:methylated-DNA-[protein]-cysteine S-methyltransferase